MPKRSPSKSPAPAREMQASGETAPTDFPIVGIGASAGGLTAFEAFFSGMPAKFEPNMSFVLVQHLAPDHRSILAELIRRYTTLPVFEVEDGVRIAPNCVYIIPPGHDLALLNGTLQLLPPAAPRGHRLPIDFFFCSLAADLRERAIGIVLSGAGSDGAHGVRAIKAEGGMVMVQNPQSTEYDGMPRSAIATGMVDFELPPAEMPEQLIAYASHAYGTLPRLGVDPAIKAESALKKVFTLLRTHTCHDFSLYKPSTIHRRIERRLAVNQIASLEDYVKYLQRNPQEVQALFRDLLIGVTSFFRDTHAFEDLAAHIVPQIFATKPEGDAVRVWSPGCATGEEAYSIAMLLAEHMARAKQSWSVQVFATDIDDRAIARARLGVYPASIAADVSSERLERFFSPEPDGSYRVQRNLRDMLLFSEQDVVKDPPFSRLDLISCRNLLIYFGAELQQKLIPLFHYALNPGGMLFLGTSESVGEYVDLFSVLEPKSKLYQRKGDLHTLRRTKPGPFLPPMMALWPGPASPGAKVNVKVSLREVTERALLQQMPVAGALVDAQGDVLYLHGRTGMYLEPAPGEVGQSNLLQMARDGLRPGLDLALRRAATSTETIHAAGLRVKTNGHTTLVNVNVCKLMSAVAEPPMASLYLVMLEQAAAPETGTVQLPAPGGVDAHAAVASDGQRSDAAEHIAMLTQALRERDDYIQGTREELESSTEELRSANEEMQSVNEELRSSNEELETSKEELQSLNEELTTVNTELQAKVADLSRANDDMNNLLAGTGIATVFVDARLRILRFTPTATQIINLIGSDIGRPVGHIVSKLASYESLLQDAQSVLDTLVPVQKEVQNTAGNWYQMHIGPYRTVANLIEGVVLTFVDISAIKQARETLRLANDQLRLAVVVRDAHDAITVQDLAGATLAWSPGAVRMYGWSEAAALAMNVRERIPPPLREQALARLHQLSKAEVIEPYRTQRLRMDGTVVDVWVTATALINEAGRMYAIATTERGGRVMEVSHDQGA